MSISDQIDADLKAAMIAKDADTLSALRLLKSAFQNAQISAGHELEDTEVLGVLEKQAKQRRDSIEQFKSGGRDDLVAKENVELGIIERYLPEKLSETELTAIIDGIIAEIKPDGIKDMGRVIQAVMAQTKGQADGGTVSGIVKSKLS